MDHERNIKQKKDATGLRPIKYGRCGNLINSKTTIIGARSDSQLGQLDSSPGSKRSIKENFK